AFRPEVAGGGALPRQGHCRVQEGHPRPGGRGGHVVAGRRRPTAGPGAAAAAAADGDDGAEVRGQPDERDEQRPEALTRVLTPDTLNDTPTNLGGSRRVGSSSGWKKSGA